MHHNTGTGRLHGSNQRPYFQTSLLLPRSAQDPHQPSEMAPGQRIGQIWKGRDLPKGDRKMIYSRAEHQETTNDHPSCSQILSPRDFHKSVPRGSDQVLHHVCGFFLRIRQSPRLPRSCYHTAEGGVDQPSPRLRGHRHRGQQLR